MSYSWDFRPILPFVGELGRGLMVSTELAIAAVVPGFIFATMLFGLRSHTSPVSRRLVAAFIEMGRAMPVLPMMVWLFYVAPAVGGEIARIGSFSASVVALSINYATLQAENMRTGAEAIPSVEIEAARSLGLSPLRVFWHIVLPQATHRSVPAALNQAVNTFKLTSLASFLSVHELFHTSGDVIQASQRPIEVYTVMALLYLGAIGAATAVVGRVAALVGARYGR